MFNNKILVAILIGLFSSTAFSQATVLAFQPVDQTLSNTTTSGAGGAISFVVTSQTALNSSSTYSINYRLTADLSACGGSSTATFDFTATFTASSGNVSGGHLGVGDGASSGRTNIYDTENLTATLTAGASSGGAFTLEGFVNTQIYGISAGERVIVDSDTVDTDTTTAAPVTGFQSGGAYASTFTVSSPSGGDGGTIGIITYRITATPEPSSALLLTLSGLAFLTSRRRP